MKKLNLDGFSERDEIKAKRKEFQEKYNKEEQKEILKLAIAEHIKMCSPGFEPQHISIWNLYGTLARVEFFHEFQGKSATLSDIKRLRRAFKPTYKCMVRDSCLSFRAEEPDKEPNAKVTTINPITIKWNGLNQEAIISWYYEAWKGEILEIKVRIDRSVYSSLFSVSYDRIEFRGGYRISGTTIHIKPNDENIQHVKWGRGSQDYPNDFTIFSTDTNLNFISFLSSLIKKEGK